MNKNSFNDIQLEEIEEKLNKLDNFINEICQDESLYKPKFDSYKTEFRYWFYWLKKYLPNDYNLVIDSILNFTNNMPLRFPKKKRAFSTYCAIKRFMDSIYYIETGLVCFNLSYW